jgi:hypothetical protein
MEEDVVYLGDAVYVQPEQCTGGVILTSGSHILTRATNTIFLDADVLQGLVKYLTARRAVLNGGGHQNISEVA